MAYTLNGRRWCDCGDEISTPEEIKADLCDFCIWWQSYDAQQKREGGDEEA